MATIASGNSAVIFFPLGGSITITPVGSASFGANSRGGSSPAPRTIYEESTIDIPSGTDVFIEAIGGDVTYTSTVSIQSPDGGVYALAETTPTKTAISASATVHTGSGEFAGYNVNSFSSSPTLTVYDNTAGSGKIVYGPVTISATGPVFLPRALLVDTGVYFTISGTLNVTPYAG